MYLSTDILCALSATLGRSSLQLKQLPCYPRAACTKPSTICCRVQKGKTSWTRCACGKKIPRKLSSLTLNVWSGNKANDRFVFFFDIELYMTFHLYCHYPKFTSDTRLGILCTAFLVSLTCLHSSV